MDYEKIAEAANLIDNVIKENAALKSLIVETSSAIIDDQSYETMQSIQDFLNSPLGDKKEIVMQKAYSAAMILAKERGILPNLPDNSYEIAATVDDALTKVKSYYQVGIGILDPEVAIDHIVDHAESRALAVVDTAFETGIIREVATEGIIKLAYAIPEIGPVTGPLAEACRPIIENVISHVEPTVKAAIKEGIHKVSTIAKSIAHSAVEKVKDFALNMAKKVSSLFS